ncbi:hypothetical protein [Marinobacter vulgaris]|uniref:hypothetical protein n=1 Tax=Marinobacter vulgaris TaxID=1928331 RepID=UPI001D0D9006|nr:hypothetical protein [Marinobacter vulgaris]
MNQEFPLKAIGHGESFVVQIDLDLGAILPFDAVLQNQGYYQKHEENQCWKCRVQQDPDKQG